MNIREKIKMIKESRLKPEERDLIMIFNEMTVSVNNSTETLYKYKDIAIFRQLHGVKLFAVNKKFWGGFGLKHKLSYDETQYIFNYMIQSYLGLVKYTCTKGLNF